MAQTKVIPVPAITLTTSEPVGTSSLSPGKALLTTSFVLHPKLPRPMDVGQPIPPPQFFTLFSFSKVLELPSPESSDNPSYHTPHESPPCMDEGNVMAPPTPGYPVAKSQAQRMVHAYSPVKSSPLSRVLSNSPDSSSIDDQDSSSGASLAPLSKGSMPGGSLFPSEAEKEDEEMPLAQQLGIPVSPPESLSLKRKEAMPQARVLMAQHFDEDCVECFWPYDFLFIQGFREFQGCQSSREREQVRRQCQVEVYTSASSNSSKASNPTPDGKAADVTAETLEEAQQRQARHRYPGPRSLLSRRCIRTETDTPQATRKGSKIKPQKEEGPSF
ncbi:hypothetical protein M378DRAFT_195915 [Amanita muscaria Koide BX008]|uniref:Uncharacterized protein n=1 Tax=Amanita muscaria (strain Koide BX008) TaxID=946122 RepID=A0A0C2T015_AMAMK|nr:hypothetical protein M378DRAFT_195915 [Amanita muscaria Koide BX008]